MMRRVPDRMSNSNQDLLISKRSVVPRPSPAGRVVRRHIDGVVLLDKPAGISSNNACVRVKRCYRAESAGHTGTLDAFATGLLPIALGEATKFAGGLLGADKTYEAHAKLGVRTETGDLDGRVIAKGAITHSPEALTAAVSVLTGAIQQVPPMYSALKREGKPLYEYARAGMVVDRAARSVTVHSFDVQTIGVDELRLRVRCSKGTYIRTLIDDLGEMLGCGAHLLALRRTAIGALEIDAAHGLTALEALDESALDALLLPPDRLVQANPPVELGEEPVRKLLMGQTVIPERLIVDTPLMMRAYGPAGRFLGLVARLPDGRIKPERLMRTRTC